MLAFSPEKLAVGAKYEQFQQVMLLVVRTSVSDKDSKFTSLTRAIDSAPTTDSLNRGFFRHRPNATSSCTKYRSGAFVARGLSALLESSCMSVGLRIPKLVLAPEEEVSCKIDTKTRDEAILGARKWQDMFRSDAGTGAEMSDT